MDIATRNSILELLPNELIAKILAMVDYRDLASCLQVCKRVFDLIGSTSSLQYHLELGRACMEDGPLSGMSTAERRERLQAHIHAWRNLQWSSCIHLFDLPPNTVIMDVSPGGILIFISRSECKLKFVQPPSNLRGIPMKQWVHTFPFPPSDVAIDPSEDVIVVLQIEEWRFHFLSLSSGEPHPLAAIFTPLDPPRPLRHVGHFQLLVSRNYVAILISGYQLMVCDWKTGQTVLCIMSTGVQSVAFLPENRLLLASTNTRGPDWDPIPDDIADGPVLAVYNLDPVSVSGRQRGRHLPVAIFALELGRDIVPFDMHLHYHLNVHSYPPGVAVPFFGSPADQLVALETSNRLKPLDAFSLPLRHIVLIPIARLLRHVDSTENRRSCYIQWDDWGATGTRRVPAPWPSHYHNALSGPRFIPRPESSDLIVWDFSRAHVAQLQICDSESIPCVQRELVIPNGILGRVTAAISEDVIVIRESLTSEERVYLLVF